MLYIPEEHIHRRQKKTKAAAEQIKLYHNQRRTENIRRHRSPGANHYDYESAQWKHKIHQRACHLCQGENVLGNITLFQQCPIPDNRAHRRIGRWGHKLKNRPSGNQIDRIVHDTFPSVKHIWKYQRHNNHNQQRIQDTPHIPQDAPPVFQLYITLYQLLEQVFILEKHMNSFLPNTHFFNPSFILNVSLAA